MWKIGYSWICLLQLPRFQIECRSGLLLYQLCHILKSYTLLLYFYRSSRDSCNQVWQLLYSKRLAFWDRNLKPKSGSAQATHRGQDMYLKTFSAHIFVQVLVYLVAMEITNGRDTTLNLIFYYCQKRVQGVPVCVCVCVCILHRSRNDIFASLCNPSLFRKTV